MNETNRTICEKVITRNITNVTKTREFTEADAAECLLEDMEESMHKGFIHETNRPFSELSNINEVGSSVDENRAVVESETGLKESEKVLEIFSSNEAGILNETTENWDISSIVADAKLLTSPREKVNSEYNVKEQTEEDNLLDEEDRVYDDIDYEKESSEEEEENIYKISDTSKEAIDKKCMNVNETVNIGLIRM